MCVCVCVCVCAGVYLCVSALLSKAPGGVHGALRSRSREGAVGGGRGLRRVRRQAHEVDTVLVVLTCEPRGEVVGITSWSGEGGVTELSLRRGASSDGDAAAAGSGCLRATTSSLVRVRQVGPLHSVTRCTAAAVVAVIAATLDAVVWPPPHHRLMGQHQQ